MAVEGHIFQAGIRELHVHDVGDAVLGTLDNTSLEAGEQLRPRNRCRGRAKRLDQLLRQVGHDRTDLQAFHIAGVGNTTPGVGKVTPATGVTDGHQADRAAGLLGDHVLHGGDELAAVGENGFRDTVIGHQVRQVENLNKREQAGCATRRLDDDVDGAVSDALETLGTVRAQLRADEQLDRDCAVGCALDIVLENDETVIVLVILVRVGSGTDGIVRCICRERSSRHHCRYQQRGKQPFEHQIPPLSFMRSGQSTNPVSLGIVIEIAGI